MKNSKPKLLIRSSWLELLSSMRFAVALLTVLAIASIVGTLLRQNLPRAEYVFQFGNFWTDIFDALGLFDVYSSPGFVAILLFLVISTGLCLWRNVPTFWREIHSLRLPSSADAVLQMKHHQVIEGHLSSEVVQRYLGVQGFKVKCENNLIAAKKGSANKWGYVLAHAALIVICLGGLIDSNLLLKINILTGRIVPNSQAVYADEFPSESRLSSQNLSFRGDITLQQGQNTQSVFLNVGDGGFLVQELPFSLRLKEFQVQYYDSGMPKNFASEVTWRDQNGVEHTDTIRVNHPLTINGVTIYQSGFGDGGSPLEFDVWDPNALKKEPFTLSARSQNTIPFQLSHQTYQITFDRLRAMNIESTNGMQNSWQDVRAVAPQKDMRNVGATIQYEIRDPNGAIFQYMNYLLPQEYDGRFHYYYGVKKRSDGAFRWMAIPVDSEGSITTAMAFIAAFNQPQMLNQAAKHLVGKMDQGARTEELARNVLYLFAQGGYDSIDSYIQSKVPREEQKNVAQVFYSLLAAASSQLLTDVISVHHLSKWDDEDERAQFVLDGLQAATALHHYPAPLLMQLKSFEEVPASTLQMTRSPGATWVYLGSFLLTVGVFLMFYLREKQIWIALEEQKIILAMSAARQSVNVDEQMAPIVRDLNKLIRDFSYD